ncbi:MAG TPA: RNA 2',3'-cyclic phosphodiesterase [Usitatibacter sp.]|nr:RNA 2',3'-cyclic phosphodiesterase [Usitatibacter sp.]
MARLFFALWPDGPASARLARLATEVAAAAGGKPVPAEKIHVTLAFLGEVAASRVEEARTAARAVRFGGFAVTLDCVGSFGKARVAWAGSLSPPGPALAALQADLAARLSASGFALEERPFALHATLARRIGRDVPRAAVDPVAWSVDAFSLVRSETGTGRYAVVEAFGAG